MIHSSEFPVRPRYQLGESLTSYVYRIHSANGHLIHEDIWDVLLSLKDRCGSPYNSSDKESRNLVMAVQDWLDQSCVLDEAWWISGLYPACIKRGGSNRARICPDCIRKFGFHPAALELPFVSACSMHQTQLLVRCPDCRSELTWTNMRSDWRCRCGHHLSSTPAPRAPSVQLLCSAMLVGAPDVVRPPSYPRHQLVNLGPEPYRVAQVYRLLGRIHRVRMQILVVLAKVRSTPTNQRDRRSIKSDPSPWVIRLLSSWPESLNSGLLRLACRYWRTNRATLVFIPPDGDLGKVVARLAENGLNRDCWPNDPVRREAERLIERYRAPVLTTGLALFNPRYTDDERQQRLVCFSVWWQSLIALRSGRCSEPSTTMHVGHPTHDSEREVTAIELLSGLIDAANNGADPARYAWLLQPSLDPGTSASPELLVRQMFDALMTLRYEELRAMRQTFHWIDEEATTRCAAAE